LISTLITTVESKTRTS